MTAVDRLVREADRILAGLSPLERALVLADACRAVTGREWQINAKVDGGFYVERYPGKG